MYTAEQIIKIGGVEWRKGRHHRVYLNAEHHERLMGLETGRYNTGNISCAWLDGEQLSNTRAGMYVTAIRAVYLDVTTGEIVVESQTPSGNSRGSEIRADAVQRIRDGIAREVAAK